MNIDITTDRHGEPLKGRIMSPHFPGQWLELFCDEWPILVNREGFQELSAVELAAVLLRWEHARQQAEGAAAG